MAYVSCRLTRIMLEAAVARGLDVNALARGAALPIEALRDAGAHVSWDQFVDFNASLAQLAGGPAELEALGAAMLRAPSESFFPLIARFVVSASQLHELGTRYVAPSVFEGLPLELVDASDRRVVLRCVLPPSFRGSAHYFHVCKGTLGAVSTLVGLPPSTVEAEITAREATYVVLLPRDERRWSAMLRRMRRWVAGRPLADLLEQQDSMRESYEALLRTRQEFHDVLARAPLAAFIHRDGRYLWVNAAAARLLGYDEPDEIVGQHVLEHVHPDDRERVVQRISAPAAASQPGEYRMRRRDGSTVLWDVAPTQVVTFHGAPARLLLANDITERARAREQLALADRLGSFGLIAASVAHEINNPLAYAQLSVQTISRGLDKADVAPSLPALRGAAATAIDGLERVRAIVADLKTFARADEETIAPTDLNDVVKTTLRLAQKTLGSASRIDVSLGDLPKVNANHGRLGQVVLNLLLNAHEAIEDRGVAGVIALRTAVDDSGLVLLEIADNGTGIPDKVLSRVFEPFYTTKAKGRGTGLGLSICHRIVGAYGGTITLESATAEVPASELRTFARVRLRVASQAAETEVASERGTPPSPARRRRILIVDDEPAVGATIATTLGEDHDVVVETGGRAARRTLAGDPGFDVVLCDVMMPDIDGIQLFEEIRAANEQLATRFVFMSGGAFSSRARSFLANAKSPSLEKPFTGAQLSAAIERLRR
ncbi:MAG: response regulator [Deltaproteobacteria bacterium]|nr:response regulator [Deltaproteobacteria bacterium]